MVQMILDGTKFNDAAFVPVWQTRFIANQGLGRIHSGICVFSRYPILENLRIAQVDRTDQDALVRSFYLHRGINQVKIEVGGGRTVTVMNVHTAAYDNDGTNGKHLVQIKTLFDAIQGPKLLGGDFNAIPPGTIKKTDFDDEEPVPEETMFQGAPYKLEAMQPFFDAFEEHMPLTVYGDTEASQSRWYSHTVAPPVDDEGDSHTWNRMLDYLFTDADSGFVGRGEVLQRSGHGADFTLNGTGIIADPAHLSDHAPVVAKWDLR
jgi:endonuclease/exonuclease/phosphatase family metal-dependent hydrolase